MNICSEGCPSSCPNLCAPASTFLAMTLKFSLSCYNQTGRVQKFPTPLELPFAQFKAHLLPGTLSLEPEAGTPLCAQIWGDLWWESPAQIDISAPWMRLRLFCGFGCIVRGWRWGHKRGREITFTEHSLGMGMALSSCLIHSKPCEVDITFQWGNWGPESSSHLG